MNVGQRKTSWGLAATRWMTLPRTPTRKNGHLLTTVLPFMPKTTMHKLIQLLGALQAAAAEGVYGGNLYAYMYICIHMRLNNCQHVFEVQLSYI